MVFSNLINRFLLFTNLIKSDFQRRYMGTYLGVLWAVAAPFSTIAVLLFVFNYGFRLGSISGVDFDVWLVSGLIVWFFISDGIASGTNSIVEYVFLIKNIRFNSELLPIIKVTSSLFPHVATFLLLIFLLMNNKYYPNIYWAQIPYYLFALFVFVIAITTITSVVQVFFKDFNNFVGIVLQIGFWATPVLWDAKILPERYEFIVKYNPANYLVQGYRESLILNGWFYDKIFETFYFWSLTLIILVFGLFLFKRTKHQFADVL